MALDSKTKNTFINWFVTLAFAIIGGFIFNLLHFPLHWLLGPMAVMIIMSKFTKIRLVWPVELRNFGLMIIGYMLGISFTFQTLVQIGHQLPSMLLATLLTLLFSAMVAFAVAKITGIDYKTILTGSIPGGLTQMVVLGEEIGTLDITVVTFIQLMRLMTVIFVVPLLVLNHLFGTGQAMNMEQANHHQVIALPYGWQVVLFIVVVLLTTYLGKKVHLPTAVLLGPIMGAAILVIIGFQAPSVPSPLLNISQVCIGAHIGLMIDTKGLGKMRKLGVFTLITAVLLVLFSMLLGYFLTLIHPISFVTGFLSTAPGGMAQMGIVAQQVDANLSIITGYQMFRIFFILFIVPPFLKWLFKRKYFL